MILNLKNRLFQSRVIQADDRLVLHGDLMARESSWS